MSSLNTLIASLVKALRMPNSSAMTNILKAVDTAIDGAAEDTVTDLLASDGDALDADSASILVASNLRQGGADVQALKAAFLQHYVIAPAAISAAGVHALVEQTGSQQVITTGITNPDFPRTLSIVGNVSGITGNVVVVGTNILDEPITETFALNGTTTVNGTKAFKTVTSITVPAQVHTPAYQVETATANGTITNTGNASVVVTASGLTGSPKTYNVMVLVDDTAAVWAGKVRDALSADPALTALYTVGGTGTSITLTRNVYAANDASLNIALDNGAGGGGCQGITTAASSANTTSGVVSDKVSVGLNKSFGLPHIVPNAAYMLLKLFDGSADGGALTADAAIEKNLYALSGTPGSAKILDLVYLV